MSNSMEKTELEKRWEAEQEAKAAGTAETAAPEDVESAKDEGAPVETAIAEETKAQLQTLENEAAQLRDQLLRARAEFDNYRRRTARETERIRKTAGESVIADLLPVLDHLELALQHTDSSEGSLAEGVRLVMKQAYDVLGRHGLEPIAAAAEAFDPNIHEAVMQREDVSVPEHTVLEVFQGGYRLGGHVLRPAKVVVSTGGPERPRAAADDAKDASQPEAGSPAEHAAAGAEEPSAE